jgi:subtilisin family serine protease
MMTKNLHAIKHALQTRLIAFCGNSKILLMAILVFAATSVFAQNNGKATWGVPGKPIQYGSDYQPKEIMDVFAAGAVTIEEMEARSKYHRYMDGELVVAIELSVAKNMAAGTLKNISWSKYFEGKPVSLINRILSTNGKANNSVSLVLLKLPANLDVFAAMKILQGQSGILWSAPNFVYDGDPRDIVPNDTRYAEQYHHPLMKNNLAWDLTQGSASIIVAVTDDGCELTHSDLAANIWVNPGEIAGDGIDNDNNGFIDDVNGWDFSFNNNNPNPNVTSDSHGTHVCGISAARINNNNGVAGVAGLSTIMPVQFYGTGGASWTAALNAQSFAYAVDNGAKVINTSYNIDGFANDPVFVAGVQYVLDAGALHFNSAGNNSQLNPARQAVTQTILVASTDAADIKSGFSNYGIGVDISAPGSGILSTVVGNTYDFYSGTSMATPNATGAAALLWSAHPTWTNYQIAAQLLATADNIDAQNPTLLGYLGSGRVNTYAAITANIGAPKVKSITGIPANGGSGTAASATSFTISYSQVMDPVSVNTLSNFELRYAGLNGNFNDGDDAIIPISTTNSYRVGTNQMTYQIGQTLVCGLYRLRIASGGLKNPFNTSLDGDGNGTGGDAYLHTFGIGALLYVDADGDGYGTGVPVSGQACTPGNGYAIVGGDCNDNNTNVNPGRTEICGNGIDDNCDGLTDFIAGTPGTAVTFSNTTPIVIPATGTGAATGAPSTPYASGIVVSGVNGTIGKLTVQLNQFNHTYPSDVDVLLVGPAGQKMLILSDPGSGTDAVNINLTLDDDAASLVSSSTLTSGTFKPTNLANDSDPFPSPAPASPYQSPASTGTATFASVFNGSNPNGTWSLYVVDDAGTDIGNFNGGWSVTIVPLSNACDNLTAPEVTVVQPSCSTSTGSITVTPVAGTGITYSIGGSYQSSNVFGTVIPGNYQVTYRNSSNITSPATPVTINTRPVVPSTPAAILGITNVCPYIGTSTQLTYSVAPVNGATSYNWTVPPVVTLISGQGTNSITVTINSNFLSNSNKLFKVSASSVCGTSGERQLRLLGQLPSTPGAIVASTGNVCPSIGTGLPITYTIRKASGASSYIWTTQAGTTTVTHPNGTGVNDTTITVTFSSGFSTSAVSVQSVNDCGVSNTRSLTVTRSNPSAPGLISGPANVCNNIAPGGAIATYSVAAMANVASYNWSVPAGVIGFTGQGTNSVSMTFPSTYTTGVISVSAVNGCGTSSARSLTVRKLLPGSLGSITVVQTALCPDRVFTYTFAAMPSNATSIQWVVPNGATLVSGQGTTSITVSYPSTAINDYIRATAVNNCGTSATRSLSVKLPVCTPPAFAGTLKTSIKPEVLLYPNPAVSNSNLLIKSVSAEEIHCRVFDLQGRLMLRFTAQAGKAISFGTELKAGAYMIEVTQGNFRSQHKLIRL